MRNSKNLIRIREPNCEIVALDDLLPGSFFKFAQLSTHISQDIDSLYYKTSLDCSFVKIHHGLTSDKTEYRIPDLESAEVIQYDAEIILKEINE